MDAKIEAIIAEFEGGEYEDWTSCAKAFAQEVGKVLAEKARCPESCEACMEIRDAILRAVDVEKEG